MNNRWLRIRARVWPRARSLGRTALDILPLVALAVSAASIIGALAAPLWHIFDLMGQFAIAAVLGALLAALTDGAMRRWRRAAIAAVVALAGIAVTWQGAPVPECEPGTPTHRIVFYNIWIGNDALPETLAYLEQTNADVIVLTELTKRSSAALVPPLAKLYPHTVPCALTATCWTAAFSRTPMTEVTDALKVAGRSPALSAIRIPFAEGEVTIAGVHLTRPWPYDTATAQRRQLDALATGLVTLPEPQLVVGDFNAVTWGATVSALVEKTKVAPIPSWGTWMANLPTPLRIPIDQALVSPGFQCATKSIGPALGSDHRPIIVDFALSPRK